MTSIDCILIDPTFQGLLGALNEAVDAINRDQAGFGRLLQWQGDEAASLAGWMHARPEGAREWRVPGPGMYGVEAALTAIWWSDFLGRRHLRLLGGCRHRGMELPAPLPSPHRPPLACVYPGACVVASQHRRPRLLAVCDCGAWGPPERLAWMGPQCGPCFDRGVGEFLASPAVLPAGGQVAGVAFCPAGRRLAIWDGWGEVALWDLETGQSTSFRSDAHPPGKLAFSPDRRYLAWCSSGVGEVAGGALQVVHLETAQVFRRPSSAFAFTSAPCQILLAESLMPCKLGRHALDQWGHFDLLTSFRLPFPVHCRDLAVSPDGQTLAASGEDGLLLWGASSGEPLHRFDVATCTGPLAWSPDGTVLACGVTARFWKAVLFDALSRQRRCVVGGTALLHALAFSPDGAWLVTAEEDAVRTWHVQTGQERQSLSLPQGDQILTLAFSPDGRTVALGMLGGRVRLWPAEMLLLPGDW